MDRTCSSDKLTRVVRCVAGGILRASAFLAAACFCIGRQAVRGLVRSRVNFTCSSAACPLEKKVGRARLSGTRATMVEASALISHCTIPAPLEVAKSNKCPGDKSLMQYANSLIKDKQVLPFMHSTYSHYAITPTHPP